MQLTGLYADFVAVLRSVPQGHAVLSEKLLPADSRRVAVSDVLGVICELSIDDKLAAGGFYDTDPYALFHDLKLAFGRFIAQFPQNSGDYDEAARLFKFAADLLVREASRLGFTDKHHSAGSAVAPSSNGAAHAPEMGSVSGTVASFGDVGSAWDDEHLQQISRGFHTISTEMQDWNGETYWVTAANGPLFMSSGNKAPVDPRDTIVSGSVHTVKLLPHVARAPESTLGFVSPLNPRVPQPDTPPVDLLGRFIHPNAHATFSPMWLQSQDSYGSFAPSSDSAGAVVGEEDATIVWADKANRPRLSKPQRAADDAARPAEGAQDDESAPAPKPEADVSMDTVDTKPELAGLSGPAGSPLESMAAGENLHANNHEGFGQEFGQGFGQGFGQSVAQNMGHDVDHDVGLSGADLEALMRWTPASFIDDDELEAARKGRAAEQELLSRLLLELQYLQNERLAAPGTELEISDKERHVALKSGNLLARLVGDAGRDEFALKLDTRLPVLMRNYTGSLPAATDPAMHGPIRTFDGPMAPPSQRLQTLASLRSRSRSRR